MIVGEEILAFCFDVRNPLQTTTASSWSSFFIFSIARRRKAKQKTRRLSVGLGDTLELVLLLDGVRVGGTLGGVDELLSEALGNRLDVAESGLTGADGQEGNGLVDTAERGDIDGLATDGTGGSDTGRVFAGTAVDNGVDGDLDGVLVGHDVDLRKEKKRLAGGRALFVGRRKTERSEEGREREGEGEEEKTHNLKGVGDNAHSHELLAVVAAVHHERVGETLDDGALGLAETLDGVTTGRVRQVHGLADLDVVGQGDVPDLDILVAPLVEQLDAANLGGHVLGQDGVALRGLDLDFTGVGHFGCMRRDWRVFLG